ncbi:uroporphyrinogen-III synthase [Brevundimonas sp. BR2-1]|uniref:uroporphyrinogen-III synthase n=1 Tax=Brevundimonas sp. BR2-1 TaxID=3031123 RepID=UPI0030A04847
MRTVWVTRAEPGATRTAARLTALGFEAVVAPLLEIRPLAARVDLDGVTALAFTSRNGVEAFAGLSPERGLPVFAVGDATAAAARFCGFGKVRSAHGALADLAALLAAEAPTEGLLLAPGAVEPAGDLAALLEGRLRARALPIYEAVETDVAPPPSFDAVLIQSARAARALRGRGPFPGGRAVALSDAVARALGGGTGLEMQVASAPRESALIEALGKPAPRV